jgi:hypothetical protein
VLNKECQKIVTIKEDINDSIFVYYSLTKFFLNQRDIARSRSYPQLRNEIDKSNYKKCEGALTVAEIFDYNVQKYKTLSGAKLLATDIANPCGLQAKAFFTGILKLFHYTIELFYTHK